MKGFFKYLKMVPDSPKRWTERLRGIFGFLGTLRHEAFTVLSSPSSEGASLTRRELIFGLGAAAVVGAAGCKPNETETEKMAEKQKFLLERLFEKKPKIEPPTGEYNVREITKWKDRYLNKKGTEGRDYNNNLLDYKKRRGWKTSTLEKDLMAGWDRLTDPNHNDSGVGYNHLEMVYELCLEAKVPFELVFLGLAESHWDNKAHSPAGARGPWQFMPETAKAYGIMSQDGSIDDRDDYKKSTEAAIKMLKEEYERTLTWEKNSGVDFDISSSDRWAWAFWSYNWGPTQVAKYFRQLKGNPRECAKILDKKGNHESAGYVQKIFGIREALKEKYKLGELDQFDSNETEKNDYPLIKKEFREAIDTGAKIVLAEKPMWAPNVLGKRKFNLGGYKDPKTGLDISTFLEPGRGGINPDHDQPAINDWLDANDRFAKKYREGRETDSDLKIQIGKLEFSPNPKIRNLVERPHLTAYINWKQPAGVEEEWRRVIRVDYLPVMDELNLRLNELLLKNGMSEDYFITAMINSTVRSQKKNRSEGGSPESAHLSFSAVDLNDKHYLVQKIEADGSITRYRDDQNLETFLNALRIVAFEMALEGKIKVRFHGGHFHIVPMVKTSG